MPRNIRRVLIVEDDAAIRRVATMALSRVGGWETLEAADGPSALAMARQQRPDLIVLDVMLPGMDGPQTLWALRSDEATASIPVIFMTARVQSHERQQYAKLGAIGVIPKPFDAMKLPAQIDALLGQQSAEVAPATEEPAPALAEPEGSSALRNRFAAALPRRVAELVRATDEALDAAAPIDARDRAIGLAHRLAGSAGTFGAPSLGSLAGELEHALRGDDDSAVQRILARLAATQP